TINGEKKSGAFLALLDQLWQAEKKSLNVKPPANIDAPYKGGWFLYLGYELAAEIEPSLDLPISEYRLPDAMAVRCPVAVIINNKNKSTTIIAEPKHQKSFQMLLDDIKTLVNIPDKTKAVITTNCREAKAEKYLNDVTRIKKYIIDGDIFQANLSREWTASLDENASTVDIFNQLRESNPAPFASLIYFKDENVSVISSSPERLVAVHHNVIETRPIAGTKPRSDSKENDKALAEELLAHPKEQAEHIMLIDLERNDLGRVCLPGSIQVNELMVLESYSHVHHIVSNIQGELRDNMLPGDIIAAVFPGGTITGCPKVRCMEILAELEDKGRGPYTGSLGYLNHDGDMDLNILIRTLYREDQKIYFRAGAGIVADSVPKLELEETRYKAKALIKALEETA
ncbi:MAG: aminodeoxychorismate synthase component I, partial [Gammaproteobacteria bacterium]|nr:aminodeoxychorismate synthase component I [Gammaproteobacteria bacterium]